MTDSARLADTLFFVSLYQSFPWFAIRELAGVIRYRLTLLAPPASQMTSDGDGM